MRWNLDDIVAKGQFDRLYAETEKAVQRLGKSIDSYSPGMSAPAFRREMEFNEGLLEDLSRLSGYCSLWEATDLKSQDAKLLKSRTDNLFVKYSEAAIPIQHWLKGLSVNGKPSLDEANAKRLFASFSDLSYVLSHMRSLARHTLAPGEERIMSRKRISGVGALSDLYDVLVDGFRYDFRPRGGRPKIFNTQEPLRRYFSSPKAAEREAAYRAVFEPYGRNLTALFLIYQAIVKDWVSDAQLRKHRSPIAMRNVYNQVPDAAIEALLATVEKNAGLFQEFFGYKARMLGARKLRRYDIMAPTEKAESNIPLERARRLVIDTFRAFAPGFAEKAEQVFRAGHIDTHPRPGKRSGAFCSNVTPKILPYVLLNYTGNNSSVSTMAHELGHAVHDIYASGHTISAAGTTLPLAETASTIAEVIVFERLLETARTPREKRALLMEKMVDAYSTIVRQAYIVKFELEAHRRMNEGIKADDLCHAYLGRLRSHLGRTVEVADEFRLEWAYIPHIFHTPFYCYAYSFGDLLSLALYARYRSQGRAFVPQIERILSYGCSKSPDDILKEVGIDMADGQFWQGSFDILRGWLDQLRKLG
jgi:oligoendopeptidase F